MVVQVLVSADVGPMNPVRRFAAILVGVAALAGQIPASSQISGVSGPVIWPQWGGPHRNFMVSAKGLADSWPEGGPRVIWSRPLGTGHSAILADDGMLFTMYRTGNGRARQGPWEGAEVVIALDAATGKTIWEHKYPSKIEDFNYGPGPHSTPLIVGDRLFTIGTNKQFFAFEKKTGKVLWSRDLVAELDAPSLLIRPVVKAGYGCSPIAYRETIICSVGGPGQSVVAFRQDTGAVVWKSGDFLVSETAPILISPGDKQQLVIFGGGTVNGLDPATGRVLWSHPHDPGNDLNINTPIFSSADNLLFVSSAYKAGSRAIRLTVKDGQTYPEELWFSNRVRYMFLSALRIGDYLYGTAGDLGPSFLTAMDIKTGQMVWQHRGIGRASMVYADGKAILLEEDGDLDLVKLAPEGVTVLAQTKLFDTMSWTAPTLAGTTLYARDREQIVALDLGKPTADRGSFPLWVDPIDLPAPLPALPSTNLSGTWKLDAARSTVSSATLPGLIKAGAPQVLHITHAANGTVIVESQINESHARLFKPGQKTSTPMWPTGSISATSRWEGRSLVSEGTQEAGSSTIPLKEVFALSADGKALTVTVTFNGPEKSESTLVYARTDSVGSCKTWPTPCKF
jgi:outer membrane protein assembly factor BamB